MQPHKCTASSASCASCGNQWACTLSLYLLLCDARRHSVTLFFLDMPMHDQAKVQKNFCSHAEFAVVVCLMTPAD